MRITGHHARLRPTGERIGNRFALPGHLSHAVIQVIAILPMFLGATGIPPIVGAGRILEMNRTTVEPGALEAESAAPASRP